VPFSDSLLGPRFAQGLPIQRSGARAPVQRLACRLE